MKWMLRLSFVSLTAAQYSPIPRWGQASALLEDVLYIHGGMTDPYNQYSYTSAPPTNELLALPLTSSFNTSLPPWKLLNATNSPALVWHTLSAFNTSAFLLFGGLPGPNSPTVLTDLNDSSIIITTSISPSFLLEPQDWASQPMRRMHHSVSSSAGLLYLTGGQKADGSNTAFGDDYLFTPNNPSFALLPATNSPPDITGHTSLILNNQLIIFGGFSPSLNTLIPFTTIWTLDISASPSSQSWSVLPVSNNTLPTSRRAFAAVVLADAKILIHGGADAELQNTYSDGWILDTTQNPMVWQSVAVLSQLGERRDHFAVAWGGMVIFGFGYTSTAPASSTLQVYDLSSSLFTPLYTPPASPPSGTTATIPGPTNTPGSGSGNGGGDNTGSGGGGNSAGGGGSGGDGSGSSGGDSHSKTNTAVTLGATFAALGLVVGALATTYYVRRRHSHPNTSSQRPQGGPGGQFFLLGGDLEETDTDAGAHILHDERASGNQGMLNRMLGFTKDRGGGRFFAALPFSPNNLTPEGGRRERRDMLADEDTWSELWREANGGSGGGGVWRDPSGGSLSAWSFRSMGARVRGMMSREPSGSQVSREASGSTTRTRNRPGEGDDFEAWDEWEKVSKRGARAGDDNTVTYRDGGGGAVETDGQDHEERTGLMHSRTQTVDSNTWSYVDPFSDRWGFNTLRSNPFGESDDEGELETPKNHFAELYGTKDIGLDGDADALPLLPLSLPSRILSPLVEAESSASSQNHASSSSSSLDHAGPSTSGPSLTSLPTTTAYSNSYTSYSPTTTRISYSPHMPSAVLAPQQHSPPQTQRHSSILDSLPPISQPIRRSDTWWGRFAKTSLIDRRSSGGGSGLWSGGGVGLGGKRVSSSTFPTSMPSEFRDPTPAPGLGLVHDGVTKDQSSPEVKDNKAQGHGHYMSSSVHSSHTAGTTETADTAGIERLGGRYDVVRREGSAGSRWTATTEGGETVDVTATVDEHGITSPVPPLPTPPDSNTSISVPHRISTPPTKHPSPSSTDDTPPKAIPSRIYSSEPSPSSIYTSPTSPRRPRTPPTPASPGAVASRIHAYERRMSQDLEQDSIKGPRNTRKREEVPSRNRVTVSYGVVPRAPLFVANPDGGTRR
ncbi:hypothetical protein SERLA73DRAFT_73355 [Serpula lacrymans var. lacrymans S7.3]|uniref:Galactose oxidase n=1 Tax=Serpula lacrymans var. lacrymans (strain S7.3) TaxID=936435 RepID=F8PXZ0_SERL3|nr:hypothetical protein SERLA73DRAFT_73355 [Serpula lacrymans var. lacrymans S7.3]